MAKSRPMELNPAWKGGRTRMSHGYVLVKVAGHPKAVNGYVLEHVLVAEKALGKYLPEGAIVHHVNGDNSDNIPSNLVILQSRGDHQRLHSKLRALKRCGNAKWKVCVFCGEYDDPAKMHENVSPRQIRYWHKECSAAYSRNRRNKGIAK